MPLQKVGSTAPAFKALDQHGKAHTLKEYAGKWVLLYFCPTDDTPGCTVEACTIRDQFADFKKIGAVVIGVSTDSVDSHRRFAEGYTLPFTLLADTDKKLVRAYGVWGKKTMMGRTYMGTKRTSFLITPSGKIAKVYEKVQPPVHAAEVIADLKSLKR
jgi:peroxiredoxin Q/BCP